MTKLDAFTLNVLCNPEVIDIDQDPLGQSAAVSKVDDEKAFIMVKDLEDGSKAVGLFNRGEFPAEIDLHWSVAGLSGPQVLRDVWRQKEIGTRQHFKAVVARRGCVLLTLRLAGTK